MFFSALSLGALLGQEPRSSADHGWTTAYLRATINTRLKEVKFRRQAAAIEIGAEFAVAGPSKSFVTAALNLFRTPDPLVRLVAYASLKAPNESTRAAQSLLQAALADPQPYNRRIAIEVLAAVAPFGPATLNGLVYRAYLDTDATTREIAQANVATLLSALKTQASPNTPDLLRPTLQLVNTLRDTLVDEGDRQSLSQLSTQIASVIEDLAPRTTPPPAEQPGWSATMRAVGSDLRLLVPSVCLAFLLFVAICAQIYYFGLYYRSPLKLFSYAHSASPLLLAPYLLAPTAYKYSRRLIGGLIHRLAAQQSPVESERLTILLEQLRQSPRKSKAYTVERLFDAINSSSEEQGRGLFLLLRSIAPEEALKLRDRIPNDPEITLAREQMRSILQVPQGTISKRGLTLEHQLNQATTISGDFYNIIPRGDGSLGIYMVDVIGHGLPASLLALQVYLVLKTAEPQWGMGRPRLQLEAADDLMRKLAGEFAVCMNFLELDRTQNVARYASAGMFPALLFPKGQTQPVELLAAGPYIGEGYKFSPTEPAESEHKISDGDILVVYSDGIVEARNSEGKLFGTTGVVAAVQTVHSREARDVRDSIIQACSNFSGRAQPEDDQSLVVIQIGQASARGHSAEETTLRVSHNDHEKIVASLQNTDTAGHAVLRLLADYIGPFALDHISDEIAVQKMKQAVIEALTNCLRHGTPKGKYVEIRASVLPNRCVEVELIQPNEWKNWDQMLGRHRRDEIVAQRAAYKRGETPPVRFLGTQLVVAHSREIECSPDGRRQRIRFGAEPAGADRHRSGPEVEENR